MMAVLMVVVVMVVRIVAEVSCGAHSSDGE